MTYARGWDSARVASLPEVRFGAATTFAYALRGLITKTPWPIDKPYNEAQLKNDVSESGRKLIELFSKPEAREILFDGAKAVYNKDTASASEVGLNVQGKLPQFVAAMAWLDNWITNPEAVEFRPLLNELRTKVLEPILNVLNPEGIQALVNHVMHFQGNKSAERIVIPQEEIEQFLAAEAQPA